MREEHRRDVEVVLDEISFRDAQLRPEGLVEVSEASRSCVVKLDVESVLVFRELDLRDWGLAALLRSSFDYGGVIVARRK